MKLFIRGKLFGHLDTMAVTDEAGQEVYSLGFDRSFRGHRVIMRDGQGGLIACIEQRKNGKKGCLVVTAADGQEVTVIERKPTLRPAYSVSGPGWEVTGSLFSTKYNVTKGGQAVAELKVSTLKSEISINDREDPRLAAVVVLAIRMALYYTQVAATMVSTAVNGTM